MSCFFEHPKQMLKLMVAIDKVRKGAKIRNRYNQVPHLTQDTTSWAEEAQWLSGRVLDSRPRVAGSSLTGINALCPCASHINPSLILVQPRKTLSLHN